MGNSQLDATAELGPYATQISTAMVVLGEAVELL